MWGVILNELKVLVEKVEAMAAQAGKEIWHIIQAVFKAEESVVMAQLFTMLKSDAIVLQNSQPGINSKDMEMQLKANAETALMTLSAQLAYTAIVTTIGTVMHDLQVPDNTGNAGNVNAASSETVTEVSGTEVSNGS